MENPHTKSNKKEQELRWRLAVCFAGLLHDIGKPVSDMPVEKYLFDAMRRLIKSGHWLANEKGARLWRFKEGLHIVWRTGAQDIVDTLTRDKVPGIPRDEDTLADILIERGLAVPKALPDGRHYRYWRMQPQGLEVTLYMLRLASTELVYSNEPPIVVGGIEVDDVCEATVTTESKQDSTRLESQPDEQIDKPISTLESATAPDQQTTRECKEQSNHDQTCDPPLHPSPTTQSECTHTESSQQVSKSISVGSTAKKPKRTSNPSKHDAISEQAITPEFDVDSIDTARNWLNTHDLAGAWLIQLATEINARSLQLGIDLLETQGKCLLPFPDTAQKLNVDPSLFIKTLEEKGWLVTDILSPMRKVQVINQVRGVLGLGA